MCNPNLSGVDGVGFTGRVRCSKCDSTDAWDFPNDFVVKMLGWLMSKRCGVDVPLHFASQQTFDGRAFRFGGEAEDHLRSLVNDDPANGYLWSRLGNFYMHAEAYTLAAEAAGRAVELNPQDIESQHNLALIMQLRDDLDKAAQYFHMVLRHARAASAMNEELRRNLVRHSLEELVEMNQDTGGRIPVFPPGYKEDVENHGGPDTIVICHYDLSKERDWIRLVDSFLGSFMKPAERHRRRGAALAAPPAQSSPPQPPLHWEGPRPHRNAPCPCGSGRRFRRCCIGRLAVKAQAT